MKTTRGNSVGISWSRSVSPALLPAPVRSVTSAAAASNAVAKKTILVVDDHPVVRDMFAGFLRGLGYRVLDAGGPHEAQELAAGPVKIDLLLTDFRMPQMNGIQLARWFHDRCPRSKVLVVSTTPWEVEPYFVKSDDFALLEKSQAFARLAGIVNELLARPAEGCEPSRANHPSSRQSG